MRSSPSSATSCCAAPFSSRFTAELCDAVLERTDSAAMLAEIERSNLFLVALDPRGEWFRYHHLFADLLQLELGDSDRRRRPAPPPRCGLVPRTRPDRRRLRTRCRGRGRGDGRRHALRECQRAAQERRRRRRCCAGRSASRRSSLLDRPVLSAGGAIAAGLLGRHAAERRRLLALAERSRSERPERWSPLAEATYWFVRGGWIDGNVGGTVTSAQTALGVDAWHRERAPVHRAAWPMRSSWPGTLPVPASTRSAPSPAKTRRAGRSA